MTTAPTGYAVHPLEGHVDVLIVGVGISGIGMAHHLQEKRPGTSFAMVEARTAIGGTWDLFTYPGIRSDSDLHTFGYEFKPWTSKNAIADASEILDYLHEVIEDDGLAPRIHLAHRVVRADFDTTRARWDVVIEHDGVERTVTCRLLFGATGYYDYEQAHAPAFPGSEEFGGRVVHPQFWPDDLDVTGRQVVVIGSGATAVTLIPALATDAAHVTMLQRSPSYVMPLPKQDPIANGLSRLLPERTAYRLTRRLNIGRQRLIYRASQRYPRQVRRLVRSLNVKALPEGYDVDTHFNPTYDPWDQRLCVVPDGDLFAAISSGRASVVTDHIARFTEDGIELVSGRHLPADVIVTATGLKLLPLGGIALSVDGEPADLSSSVVYKSCMLSGLPNLAFAFGYTNASWTLKVDLVCEHVCRLLAHMEERGHDIVTPVLDDTAMETRPMLDFPAGYILRAVADFPRQGTSGPWTVEMDYRTDHARLRRGPVTDPALRFATASGGLPAADRDLVR